MVKMRTLDEQAKQKWSIALSLDIISSGDSYWHNNCDDGVSTKVYVMRPLTWRATKVTDFFHQLDKLHKCGTSQRSKEMTHQRTEGIP